MGGGGMACDMGILDIWADRDAVCICCADICMSGVIIMDDIPGENTIFGDMDRAGENPAMPICRWLRVMTGEAIPMFMLFCMNAVWLMDPIESPGNKPPGLLIAL